jgi:hypothetical protein
MISLARIKARDRRQAAVHEAGHYVVAWHFRIPVSTWITPNDTSDPRATRTWLGRAQIQLVGKRRLSAIRQAMIGVAGAVAEDVWESRTRPGEFLDVNLFLDVLEPASMSPTDWEMTGCQPGEPNPKFCRAVEQTWELLDGELWAPLLRGFAAADARRRHRKLTRSAAAEASPH